MHRDKIARYMKEYGPKHRQEQRTKAMLILANYRGDDEPRCRIDLTPDTPVSHLPCVGALEIDHLNGNGRRELIGTNLVHHIVKGQRKLGDLRLLCQVHQLWNQIRKQGQPPGRYL